MSRSRKHQRFIRRLETEFSANGKTYIGISSDFSEGGLFVRTNHAFIPGTIIELTVRLPEGKDSKLKGRVRRATKTPVVAIKNGMGIELIEKDGNYTDFITSFSDGPVSSPSTSPPASGASTSDEMKRLDISGEFMILICPQCSIRNKVKRIKLPLGPRCGKCGTPLVAA